MSTIQLDTRQPGEKQTSCHPSEQGTVQGAKRRRNSGDRAALGITADQQRYLKASLGGGTGRSAFLDGPRARTDPQIMYPANHRKAKSATAARLETYEAWKESTVEVCIKTGAILSITWDREFEGARDRVGPGSATSRKYAIHYVFLEIFGAAEESEWPAPSFHPRMSLPRVIMSMLNIPESAKEEVAKVMREISASHKAKTKYDPSANIKTGRGAKVLIEDYTEQADVVYRAMKSGMSLGSTLVLLNQWRRVRTMEPVCYGCLQRFVSHSPVMVLEKRETVKAGSADMDTTWALARKAFAMQLVRQLSKGRRIASGGLTYVPSTKANPPATRLRTRGAWTRTASTTSRARCASTVPCRGSTRTATPAGSSARGRPRRSGTSWSRLGRS